MNFVKSCRKVNVIRVPSLFETRVYGNVKHRYLHSIVPNQTSLVTDRTCIFSSLLSCNQNQFVQTGILPRSFCSDSGKASGKISNDCQQNVHKKVSRKEQLKLAVRDYGGTFLVLHVGISLISLTIFYSVMLNYDFFSVNVLDGVMVQAVVDIVDCIIAMKGILGERSFLVAYAVHRLFFPVRIGIALLATPFVVRYLRKLGVFKMPKS